jgi:putative oxidoreductase
MATKTLTGAAGISGENAILPLVGRLMIALIFVLSGTGKLAAPAATIGYIASSGLPLPQLGYALALLVEPGGGILLVLGYRTRLVAAVLALFSLATALAFHNHLADQSQMINFLKNIAMAGGLLFVVQAGAGRISLDARL